MVLFLGDAMISTGEITNNNLFSTSSINTSGNLNEKSETIHYSSYAGGSACCPTGRFCEFNQDYGSCICRPSEYDPHCMYDGCEEIIVKGRKQCSCPCKGHSPIVQGTVSAPIIQPTPTIQPQTTKVNPKTGISKDTQKEVIEEIPFANLNITLLNGSNIIYNSDMNTGNITVQPGTTVKIFLECLESNIPGHMAILENGKIVADKYTPAQKTNNLTYSYQALHDQEWTFTYNNNDDVIITDEIVIIQIEKILPKISIPEKKPIEASPQSMDYQGSIAVISSSKNSVVNN